jgi:hypothetical protein
MSQARSKQKKTESNLCRNKSVNNKYHQKWEQYSTQKGNYNSKQKCK